MKTNLELCKTIKTLENQPIMVKTITSKKVQITARIGMVICFPKTPVSHRFEKKTIAIASPQKFDLAKRKLKMRTSFWKKILYAWHRKGILYILHLCGRS